VMTSAQFDQLSDEELVHSFTPSASLFSLSLPCLTRFVVSWRAHHMQRSRTMRSACRW
jgi:hypothetical protein